MESGRTPPVIAVDTNIICYYWLPSPLSRQVETLEQKDPEWIVPPLWRSEFRNALAASVRHGVLAMEDAVELVERAEDRLRDHEIPVSSRSVMALVSMSSCSAYDCEFVAVASNQGIYLITSDRQVLREFPGIAVSLEKFLAA